MRVSADSKDPYYNECTFYCEVRCNGVKITGVVTADTVLGEVICVDYWNADMDSYTLKKIKGKVQIIPGPRVEIRGGRLQFAEDM